MAEKADALALVAATSDEVAGKTHATLNAKPGVDIVQWFLDKLDAISDAITAITEA